MSGTDFKVTADFEAKTRQAIADVKALKAAVIELKQAASDVPPARVNGQQAAREADQMASAGTKLDASLTAVGKSGKAANDASAQLVAGLAKAGDAAKTASSNYRSLQKAAKLSSSASSEAAGAMAQASKSALTAAGNFSRAQKELKAVGGSSNSAATNLAKVQAELTAIVAVAERAAQGLSKVGSAADQARSSGTALSSSFSGLQGLIAGGAGAAGLTQTVRIGSRFEGYEAAAGILGDAGQEMQYIEDQSDRLAMNLNVANDNWVKFGIAANEAGFELATSREIFESTGMTLRVLQKGAAASAGVFKALEQMASKSKVTAEELKEQLGDQLPGALSLASKAMGVTTQELLKMMENGELYAKDLLPKLAKEMQRVYGPAFEQAARSTGAELTRLSNTMQLAAREIYEGGFGQAVGDEVRALTAALSDPETLTAARRLGEALGSLVTATGDVVRFLSANSAILESALAGLVAAKVVTGVMKVAASLRTLAASAGIARLALVALGGPYALAAAGAAALAAAVYNAADGYDDLNSSQLDYMNLVDRSKQLREQEQAQTEAEARAWIKKAMAIRQTIQAQIEARQIKIDDQLAAIQSRHPGIELQELAEGGKVDRGSRSGVLAGGYAAAGESVDALRADLAARDALLKEQSKVMQQIAAQRALIAQLNAPAAGGEVATSGASAKENLSTAQSLIASLNLQIEAENRLAGARADGAQALLEAQKLNAQYQALARAGLSLYEEEGSDRDELARKIWSQTAALFDLKAAAATARDAERDQRRAVQETARAHSQAVGEIEARALELLPAYDRQVAQAVKWRDEQLANLDQTKAGYADFAAEVQRIYSGMLAQAEEQRAEDVRRANQEVEEAHQRAVEAIRAESLRLMPVYDQMSAEAAAWRDEQLANLDQTKAGYADFAAEVERIYAEQLADAQRQHLEESKSAFDGLRRALVDIKAESEDWASGVETVTKSSFSTVADTLTDIQLKAKSASDAFKQMANSIIRDIVRMVNQKMIAGPIAEFALSAIGGLFGSGSSSGTAAAAISGSASATNPTSILHGGGIAGRDGMRRSVDPSVFVAAPRYHTGGIATNEVPAVLEQGEGVFTPRQMDNADQLIKTMAALASQSRTQRAFAEKVRFEVHNVGNTPVQVRSVEPEFDADGALKGLRAEISAGVQEDMANGRTPPGMAANAGRRAPTQPLNQRF